mmetsp:Transcript_6086/g.6233  ORF Transcript_6086/g.6233 Transcript_6086/m.6233 type:complete len:202 (+) Transcript_6086:717-1322(+)
MSLRSPYPYFSLFVSYNDLNCSLYSAWIRATSTSVSIPSSRQCLTTIGFPIHILKGTLKGIKVPNLPIKIVELILNFFLIHLAILTGKTFTAVTQSSSPNVNTGSTGVLYFTANRMNPVLVFNRTSSPFPSVLLASSNPPGNRTSDVPAFNTFSHVFLLASIAPNHRDISRTIGILNRALAPNILQSLKCLSNRSHRQNVR